MKNVLSLRKRNLFAIILVIFALIASNKYWLTFKPISVDFDIKNQGSLGVKVLLNKKDNNEFLKFKAKKIYIDLDGNYNHLSFNIARVKKAKRFRLLFTCSGGGLLHLKISTLKMGNIFLMI